MNNIMCNMLDKFKFYTEWIKRNWLLIAAASTVYGYTIGIASTLVFFDTFKVDVSPFFSVSDYLRIFFRDSELLFAIPLFTIIIVTIIPVYLSSAKRFTEQEGNVYSGSLFLLFASFIIFILLFVSPFVLVKHQADMIKKGSYKEVGVNLKNGDVLITTILGGNSEIIFVYNSSSDKAKAIKANAIQSIIFNGENEILINRIKERSEEYRQSRELFGR